jgi:hypothetical protein
MNKGQLIGLIVGLLSLPITSAFAQPYRGVIKYIRQDGNQIIRIDLADGSFQFTDPARGRSDLGGIVKDCSYIRIKCLSLSGYLFAIPKLETAPNSWSASGAKFSIVGRVDRGKLPVYLVKVSAKGDAYMFFSYSSIRGVESISLQREGVGADMAKTFFLVGDRGLLAEK